MCIFDTADDDNNDAVDAVFNGGASLGKELGYRGNKVRISYPPAFHNFTLISVNESICVCNRMCSTLWNFKTEATLYTVYTFMGAGLSSLMHRPNSYIM